MNLSNHNYIIIGGGGHAKIIAEILNLTHCHILGYTDKSKQNINFDYLGDDDIINNIDNKFHLTLGIGGIKSTAIRAQIRQKFSHFSQPAIAHPRAIISPSVRLNAAVQIMAGAIIETDTIIQTGSIINSGAIINHDCQIGTDCHICPGAIICGGVQIGNNCIIGPGAIIGAQVKIHDNITIGAGAVIRHDIMESGLYF